MTDPIRIIHVVGALTGGGIQSFLLGLVEHLPREEFHSTIIEMSPHEGPLAPDARRHGADIHALGTGAGSFARRFAALLASAPCQVVHVHRSGGGMALPLAIAARVGVPVRIAHFQNLRRPPGGGLARRLAEPMLRRIALNSATHLVGVSRAVLRSQLPALLFDAPHTHLIPNAIDTAAIAAADPAGVRAEFCIPPDALLIGNVARFSPAKDHATLIEILAILRQRGIPAHLLLVGDGDLRPTIQAAIARHALAPHVTLAGWRRDVPRLLRAMDRFLFPSLWEGLPLALLEAQAAGLPCIASRIDSNIEALAPVSDPWTFTPRDAAGAAALIERLSQDPTTAAALSAAGIEHARRHDIRTVAAQVAGLYRQALPRP